MSDTAHGHRCPKCGTPMAHMDDDPTDCAEFEMQLALDCDEVNADPSTPAPSAPVTCFICGGDNDGRVCACHDGQGQPCDMVCNEPTKPVRAASSPTTR